MRCFLDFNYGKRAMSKDEKVQVCTVQRFNRWTKKNKNIKLYYVEFNNLFEMQTFADKYGVTLEMQYEPLSVDDCHFDMLVKVNKSKTPLTISRAA